jgi:hypothetical protein
MPFNAYSTPRTWSWQAKRGSSAKEIYFLVVEPTVEHEGEESVRLRRTLRGLGVAADVIVVSEQYVAEWRDVRGSLVHAAIAEGRVLTA